MSSVDCFASLTESGREALHQPVDPAPPTARRGALDAQEAQVQGLVGAEERTL